MNSVEVGRIVWINHDGSPARWCSCPVDVCWRFKGVGKLTSKKRVEKRLWEKNIFSDLVKVFVCPLAEPGGSSGLISLEQTHEMEGAVHGVELFDLSALSSRQMSGRETSGEPTAGTKPRGHGPHRLGR